ncbi:MAG TPA: hypothetical protein PLC52_04915 [Anaerolineales bacterium]|nr:hypothetical protein [Anaerolineales bacterium]HRQ92191.1 hypothetical protein [Anaerolineales bacterium]
MADKSVWLIDSPVSMVAGEQIAYSVDWQGATSVSTAQATVYRNGADITSEAMDAGDAHIITGSVLTLKKLRALDVDGGASYVVMIAAVVDGNHERRKLRVQVVSPSAES